MNSGILPSEPLVLFDVVEVDTKTNQVRLMGINKTRRNADAVEEMAVYRRGVETHFFSVAKAGKYKDGDKWKGDGL